MPVKPTFKHAAHPPIHPFTHRNNQIGKKTLCVGLSTTHFRSARFSSHEVFIPKSQTMWLEELLNKHPEEEGWRGACRCL